MNSQPHQISDGYTFHEIYTFFYKRACLFVNSYIHDSVAAEDIASESLIKLWSVIQGKSDGAIEPLLFTILRNKSLDWLKHERIRQRASKDIAAWQMADIRIRMNALESYEPGELFAREIQDIIQSTLAEMPAQRRNVYILSRVKNMSNKEIADRLGLSVKGVEYHITQCLKQLRITLKDYLPFLILFVRIGGGV